MKLYIEVHSRIFPSPGLAEIYPPGVGCWAGPVGVHRDERIDQLTVA
jgi:hypothetical protein